MIDSNHKKYLIYIQSETSINTLKKFISEFLEQERLESHKEYKVDINRAHKEYLPNGMNYNQFLREYKLNELLN